MTILKPEQDHQDQLNEHDIGEGLTDDERVSREEGSAGDGARVTPGPADEERLPDQ
ncbi:hypothetical protein [Pseudomonas fluorescens]|nr:hypothetical protein [Pseudomonas fluorescens]